MPSRLPSVSIFDATVTAPAARAPGAAAQRETASAAAAARRVRLKRGTFIGADAPVGQRMNGCERRPRAPAARRGRA
ncbi:hypothetical protein DM75_4276 [Burkholderia mallei]|nr:hypothetical protein DM75_4276 [Burkholderia mallei]